MIRQNKKLNQRNKSAILDKVIIIISIAMVIYHLISTQYSFQGSYEHQTSHLAFALLLIFLNAARNAENSEVN